MNEFEKVIKEYLDGQAASDAAFASKYGNPNKSVEECCKYIIQQVKKSKREGFADAEIYGMALHYYDETKLEFKDYKGPQPRVVVNHTIELTEAEQREAREKARAKFEADELKKLQDARAKAQTKKKAEPVATMLDLFS